MELLIKQREFIFSNFFKDNENIIYDKNVITTKCQWWVSGVDVSGVCQVGLAGVGCQGWVS